MYFKKGAAEPQSKELTLVSPRISQIHWSADRVVAMTAHISQCECFTEQTLRNVGLQDKV